jgi:hypothetical protein
MEIAAVLDGLDVVTESAAGDSEARRQSISSRTLFPFLIVWRRTPAVAEPAPFVLLGTGI